MHLPELVLKLLPWKIAARIRIKGQVYHHGPVMQNTIAQ